MKNKKLSINIVVTMMIWTIVFFIKYQYDIKNVNISLENITFIGVIINMYCVLAMIIIERKITSPYTLFQCISVVFLYGQLICREIIGFNVEEIYDLKNLVSENAIINACFLIIYCQLSLHLGVLVYKILGKNNEKKKIYIEEGLQLKVIKKLGYFLLIISVIPAFYDFFSRLNGAMVLGYDGLVETTTYGLYSVLSKLVPFFKIALFCLMIAYKNEKNIAKFILVFGVTFYGIQMLFGNRGIPLITVITMIWLYNIAIKRIDKKIFISLLIAIIPITAIITVIRDYRTQSGMSEWIFNMGALVQERMIENNPVFETMYEMGTAIYPTSFSIDTVPEKVDYQYGKSYVLSVFSIAAINTSNEKNNLAYEMNVAAQMTELSGSTFGGSYIEEAYANFGWLSPIFIFFIGIMFEILNKRINKEKIFINLVLIAYFLNPLLWTIRNVMVTLPREFVWYMLPTYILYKLFYNSKTK